MKVLNSEFYTEKYLNAGFYFILDTYFMEKTIREVLSEGLGSTPG